jgi:hypothetical protein
MIHDKISAAWLQHSKCLGVDCHCSIPVRQLAVLEIMVIQGRPNEIDGLGHWYGTWSGRKDRQVRTVSA